MNKAKTILKRIAEKGGLYGSAAKMYLKNKDKAHEFILECYDQTHIKTARRMWGNDLVKEIIRYQKNYDTRAQRSIVINGRRIFLSKEIK